MIQFYVVLRQARQRVATRHSTVWCAKQWLYVQVVVCGVVHSNTSAAAVLQCDCYSVQYYQLPRAQLILKNFCLIQQCSSSRQEHSETSGMASDSNVLFLTWSQHYCFLMGFGVRATNSRGCSLNVLKRMANSYVDWKPKCFLVVCSIKL